MTRINLIIFKSVSRARLRLAAALLCAAAFLVPVFIVHAASPSSGTINPTTASQVSWTGTATGSNGALVQETDCQEGVTCDTYTLNVSGTPSDWTNKIVHVEISWTVPANDYDLYVHKGSNGGEVACSLADTGEPEACDFRPSSTGTGTYTVHVVYSTVPPASAALDQYRGTVKVNAAPPPPPTPPPAPVGTGAAPRFQNVTPQPSILARSSDNGLDAGEPSIGVDWKTNVAMYISDLTTFRVLFDDSCPTTANATWLVKNAPNNATSLDPILYVDHGYDNVNPQTGRTFSSQLSGTTSLMSFSDDDGETWVPSQGGSLMSGIDHQTVGGGPFHSPLPAGATYPNAIYYCSQDVGAANCALSVDGGATFGPAVPIYTATDCTGLHGHIKVAPDGTAYVPNRGCGGSIPFHDDGQQAVVVSEDNGATWSVRAVPNSQAAAGDPAVAVGKNGRLYFAYANADTHPAVAVSDDRGLSWHDVKDVGAQVGIQNVNFPAVVAGDNNRAAFAFLGSTTAGDGSARDFPGSWHIYVSATYDGGVSWQTVDATPNDPVQRFGSWRGGGSPVHRNLLDFIGIDVDKQGRVLVAYADGCAGAACVQAPANATGNAYSEVATIARQTGGRRLFSQFDPATNTTVPGAPYLVVGRDGGVAHLSWSQSDDGGASITGYKVFRTPQGGSEQLIAALGAANKYDDTGATANTTYTYRVVATNSAGDSCGSNAVTAKPQGDSCTGLVEVIDPAGDQKSAPANADLDIQSIAVSDEVTGGVEKITFKLKVADLSTLVPNRQWRVLWNYPQPPAPAPSATPAPFTGQYYVGMD
ncbi:MAG: fibronectin type III domain-containing protein, partial [Acidobacteria bacterium]|nr:fibronectin type III domain-containing protein [Acidobacteriota bacterium]